MTNEKGFSRIQIVIAVVAVLVLGAGLLYLTSTSTSSWKAYTNSSAKYSLRYPKSWVSTTCQNNEVLLLAVDQTSLGSCKVAGQMVVVSAAGDFRSAYGLTAGYSGVSTKSVKVDGVTGKEQIGTVSDSSTANMPAGTKVVEYFFYTNGRTYAAAYARRVSAPDVQNEFVRMITTTLKFIK